MYYVCWRKGVTKLWIWERRNDRLEGCCFRSPQVFFALELSPDSFGNSSLRFRLVAAPHLANGSVPRIRFRVSWFDLVAFLKTKTLQGLAQRGSNRKPPICALVRFKKPVLSLRLHGPCRWKRCLLSLFVLESGIGRHA